MTQQDVVIPEKIFFKIGEVCEIVGVQAHVLRYWETEFPMFSPQKNKSGQRSYRRKDVETALNIKQLLYKEMFTIAGARKKLQADAREANKPKTQLKPPATVPAAPAAIPPADPMAPSLFDSLPDIVADSGSLSDNTLQTAPPGISAEQKALLIKVVGGLNDIRQMLRARPGL